MKDSLYRRSLAHAWQLTWRHKFLWVFGLFAAPLGQMGLFEFFKRVDMFTIDPSQVPLEASAFPFKPIAAAVFGSLTIGSGQGVWLIWLAILLFGLFAGLVFVAVASQGALIHTTAQSLLRKKEPNTDIAWHAGTAHAGRLFFILLFRAFTFGVLGLAFAWGVYAATINPNASDLIVYLLLAIGTVGVGMIVSFLAAYAAGYVVVEEFGVFRSIAEAWKLFISHWLVSFEIGALLLGVSLVGMFLSFFSLLMFFFPAVLVWLIAMATGNLALFVSASLLATVLSTMVIMMLSSWLTVFSTATWTHLFMHMHRRGVASRIVRWATHS